MSGALRETGQQALIAAVAELRAAGVENPAVDARALLAHALGIEPARLSMVVRDPLEAGGGARFRELVAARARRQPLAQIVGARWFYGRKFRVTSDTLDPRPETELLVDEALSAPFSRVLDLGTGTGAIAISLLAERPTAEGVASDLSSAALAVARENADIHALGARLQFVEGAWFAPLRAAGAGPFDLIVSNPPYITEAEMADLAPEVRGFEPHMALTPGGDGLEPYRVIAAEARDFLNEGGRVIVEIGHLQGPDVALMFAQAGFADVRVLQDLNGCDRVVCARLL